MDFNVKKINVSNCFRCTLCEKETKDNDEYKIESLKMEESVQEAKVKRKKKKKIYFIWIQHMIDASVFLNGDEILILGGNDRGSCYSYHTIKKGYRFITLYPERAATQGHIVVRYDKILHNQLNPESENGLEMVLLSIGGKREIRPSHTLVMKYHSVWDDTNTKINAKTNEWVSLTEEKTNELIKFKEYLDSARGCLSGKNGNLLIVSVNKTIDVINLDTCQYLSTISNLPSFFLSVKYDESNNIVKHEELSVITSLSTFLGYGYVELY
ncbi:hypothetical protein RFI_33128 [Reticulomyxa filosa]|uniref:Uncharacterized protein n=1 Tax=Reticulomyxa filosa TaxID=46433 RepID=X6LU61_RETFI|nr:hypothetical protein RFI_33128 [Reticulomyxa filosa]|eukprot:ETO04270.1 hypothetical protein RFI_33128 [Reticulomyxa filosa]